MTLVFETGEYLVQRIDLCCRHSQRNTGHDGRTDRAQVLRKVVEDEEKGASGAEVVSGEQAKTGPAKRVQRARRRQPAASSLNTSPTTIPPRSSTLCPSFMPGQPAIALIVGGKT